MWLGYITIIIITILIYLTSRDNIYKYYEMRVVILNGESDWVKILRFAQV